MRRSRRRDVFAQLKLSVVQHALEVLGLHLLLPELDHEIVQRLVEPHQQRLQSGQWIFRTCMSFEQQQLQVSISGQNDVSL